MLSVVMLNIIVLSVAMFRVVLWVFNAKIALQNRTCKRTLGVFYGINEGMKAV
jgi:hypothetical protein